METPSVTGVDEVPLRFTPALRLMMASEVPVPLPVVGVVTGVTIELTVSATALTIGATTAVTAPTTGAATSAATVTAWPGLASTLPTSATVAPTWATVLPTTAATLASSRLCAVGSMPTPRVSGVDEVPLRFRPALRLMMASEPPGFVVPVVPPVPVPPVGVVGADGPSRMTPMLPSGLLRTLDRLPTVAPTLARVSPTVAPRLRMLCAAVSTLTPSSMLPLLGSTVAPILTMAS